MKNILSGITLGIICACLGVGAYAQEEFPYVAEVSAKEVNLRAGQSSSSEQIGTLRKGEKVVVVDRSYSWLKVKIPGHAESYISTDFVKDLGGGMGEVRGSRVNVRAGPSLQSTVLGQAERSLWLRIFDQKGRWYQIEPIDKSYGWVLGEYLTFHSRDIPPPRVVSPPTRNIYEIRRMNAAKAQREETLQAPLPKEKAPEEVGEEASERVDLMGIVEGLGERALSQDIRHRLVSESQGIYLLQGYRRILDGFLRHKVRIEGRLQPDIEAPYPVILVTKINLVL